MKKIIVGFIIILLLSILICRVKNKSGATNKPEVEWIYTYEGLLEEGGKSVLAASDGGYLIAGFKYIKFEDVNILKVDEKGKKVWEQIEGDFGRDYCEEVLETSDGGYIIAGYSDFFESKNWDAMFIKVNELGDPIWLKNDDSPTSSRSYSIKETNDNSFIAVGYIRGGRIPMWGEEDADDKDVNIYLLGLGSSGDSIWTKVFGSDKNEFGYSVDIDSDGGYIIVGKTDAGSEGKVDVYVIKTDSYGEEYWSKNFGGSEDDYGEEVIRTTSGDFIIVGSTESFGSGKKDVYLLKINKWGRLLWSKTYGNEGNDIGNSIKETSDGGYIIAGTTYPVDKKNSDVYLIRTDSLGDTLWTMTVDNEGNEQGNSIDITEEGGYIVGGSFSKLLYAKSMTLLVKLGPDPQTGYLNIE